MDQSPFSTAPRDTQLTATSTPEPCVCFQNPTHPTHWLPHQHLVPLFSWPLSTSPCAPHPLCPSTTALPPTSASPQVVQLPKALWALSCSPDIRASLRLLTVSIPTIEPPRNSSLDRKGYCEWRALSKTKEGWRQKPRSGVKWSFLFSSIWIFWLGQKREDTGSFLQPHSLPTASTPSPPPLIGGTFIQGKSGLNSGSAWPGASYLAFMSLSFFLSKVGIIMTTS